MIETPQRIQDRGTRAQVVPNTFYAWKDKFSVGRERYLGRPWNGEAKGGKMALEKDILKAFQGTCLCLLFHLI